MSARFSSPSFIFSTASHLLLVPESVSLSSSNSSTRSDPTFSFKSSTISSERRLSLSEALVIELPTLSATASGCKLNSKLSSLYWAISSILLTSNSLGGKLSPSVFFNTLFSCSKFSIVLSSKTWCTFDITSSSGAVDKAVSYDCRTSSKVTLFSCMILRASSFVWFLNICDSSSLLESSFVTLLFIDVTSSIKSEPILCFRASNLLFKLSFSVFNPSTLSWYSCTISAIECGFSPCSETIFLKASSSFS